MCSTCGCGASGDGLSKVESIKLASNHLRGDLAKELLDDAATFSEAGTQLLKFHGVYQQEDRDRRKEARRLGLGKHHQLMVRTRIPGGVVSAAGYLAHDDIAGRWGNDTLRVTTRQDFQLHGVLKSDLRSAIQAINAALLTTLGGCGDVERNVMCCPAPIDEPFRQQLSEALSHLVTALTPATGAYHEIWLDGELAVSSSPAEDEPLYGDAYLPRKFKTAIALDDDNCVDVHANDLGLVAHRGHGGGLDGFTVLVGGGLGRTRNKPDTFAAVAQPLAWVPAEQVVAVSRAVVVVQRDHGNRADRRHARLKYLIAERGLGWFRDEVQRRLEARLEPPRPLHWPRVDDHLGWNAQGDGRDFLGVHVDNGRISDTPKSALRTALRSVIEEVGCEVRLTPQQNLMVVGIETRDRRRVERLLEKHGVDGHQAPHPVRRLAMACPATPTCGLAVAESERVMPALVERIAALVDELGLSDSAISCRMTGCPNGCARPYLGDIGLVGTTLGKYDVFLGGDPQGSRLNVLYQSAVPLDCITQALRPVLAAFADERSHGEAFGDWCHRQGVAALAERFTVIAPAADDELERIAVGTAS